MNRLSLVENGIVRRWMNPLFFLFIFVYYSFCFGRGGVGGLTAASASASNSEGCRTTAAASVAGLECAASTFSSDSARIA